MNKAEELLIKVINDNYCHDNAHEIDPALRNEIEHYLNDRNWDEESLPKATGAIDQVLTNLVAKSPNGEHYLIKHDDFYRLIRVTDIKAKNNGQAIDKAKEIIKGDNYGY